MRSPPGGRPPRDPDAHPGVTGSKGLPAETAGMNTTPRPAPLDLAARQRATDRLNRLTAGAALAGAVAVVGFGTLAAATYSGTTATNASVVTDTSTSGTAPASTTGSTTTGSGFANAQAPTTASQPGHVTTGGS